MRKILLFSAGSLLATLAAVQGQGINVNFVGAGNGASPAISLASTDVAGVVPQSGYTNITTGTGGTFSLSNGATLTFTASGFYSSIAGATIAPADGDEKLNTGFVYGNGNFTISGIPFASYNLYVYELNDASGRVETTTLGGTSYYGSSATPGDSGHVDQNASTPYTYTQTTSTNSATPTTNGDYVLFSNLSGSSVTFSSTATGNGFVNGFQIVPVPEPGAFAALAGGVGMLLALRRRRS